MLGCTLSENHTSIMQLACKFFGIKACENVPRPPKRMNYLCDNLKQKKWLKSTSSTVLRGVAHTGIGVGLTCTAHVNSGWGSFESVETIQWWTVTLQVKLLSKLIGMWKIAPLGTTRVTRNNLESWCVRDLSSICSAPLTTCILWRTPFQRPSELFSSIHTSLKAPDSVTYSGHVHVVLISSFYL